jgi:hypothetical protein
MIIANSAVNFYPDFVIGSTYAKDDKREYEGKTWRSSVDGNVGNVPGAVGSETFWSLDTASNAVAMFDDEVNTKTLATGALTFTLAASYCDTVGLLGLIGMGVEVQVTKDGGTIYEASAELWDSSLVTDWSDFLLNEPEFIPDVYFSDMPPVPDVLITITITGLEGEQVGLGMCVIGRLFDAGVDQFKMVLERDNHTVATFDKFNKLTQKNQVSTKNYSCKTIIDNKRFDQIAKRLALIADEPVLGIGSTGLYASFIVYGLFSYRQILEYETESSVEFNMKGLI